jgi:hypothetical protein
MMRTLLLLAALLGTAWQAHAATVVTVNWKASDDNGFGLADGTPLPNGNEVRLGTFDFASNVSGNVHQYVQAGDFMGLASHFTLFDTAYIGTSAGASLGSVPLENRAGLFEKSSGPISVPTGSPLFGRQIFLWVFKTTGNDAVLPDFANITATGLFSSDTVPWLFPSDTNNGVPGSTSIELTNLSNATNDGVLGSALIPVGGFGGSTVLLATGDNHVFRLVPVPEPGVALFFAVGALPFFSRRYRRAG